MLVGEVAQGFFNAVVEQAEAQGLLSNEHFTIWGGRAQVRRVLYMATVAGLRSNPVIKNFYTQLRARGKYPKSALTACMRKLLVILNAMLHNKTHWQTPALPSSTSPLSPFLGAVPEHGCC